MRSGYISDMRRCSINMHVQQQRRIHVISVELEALGFLHTPSSTPSFVGVSNEGSSESEPMHRQD